MPVTVGAAPPAKETAPPLPVLSAAEFDGNAIIAEFARNLAACRARRSVQAEVDLRYKTAVEQAKKQSDTEATINKDRAIAEALDAINAAHQGTSQPTMKRAVDKARKEAIARVNEEAKQKKAQAVAAVSKPELATVQAELQTNYEKELATDFELTMQRVLAENGPIWQQTMLSRIIAGKKQKETQLKKYRRLKRANRRRPYVLLTKLMLRWRPIWCSCAASSRTGSLNSLRAANSAGWWADAKRLILRSRLIEKVSTHRGWCRSLS